jgi:hypothetical protein
MILDTFTITDWRIDGSQLTVTADGEITKHAWDPQDEVTYSVADVTFSVPLSDLEEVPTTTAEVEDVIGGIAEPEWET